VEAGWEAPFVPPPQAARRRPALATAVATDTALLRGVQVMGVAFRWWCRRPPAFGKRWTGYRHVACRSRIEQAI
jgi:hypothetical protein